jgi:uncharacterized protein (DUF111 family)
LVQTETLHLLETNLDDVSGETIGYCTSQLLEAGALDVFTSGIQMKKNRPGVLLSVLCHPVDSERLETIIFRETTTLGIRRSTISRRKLSRESHQVQTSFGPIDGIVATLPNGEKRFSPEYEACRRIAETKQLPLADVFGAAMRSYQN